MKFYALPYYWYDPGTEVIIIDEYTTVYDKEDVPSLHLLARGYKDGSIDEEICCSEEFAMVANDYFDNDEELRSER